MKRALLFLIVAAAIFGSVLADPPPQIVPPLNLAVTPERVALGRKLFFDTRLSINGTVSCSTCHDPNMGWADHNKVAIGVNGRQGTRNSPTIINSVYSPLMFHDSRTVGQPSQALQPIVNFLEMGGQSEQQVLNRLRSDPKSVAEFIVAYGPNGNASPIDRNRFGHAIACFESTIVSFGAPIDRRLAGDIQALTPEAEKGFGIFLKSRCIECHKPPLYTDFLHHNNGMEVAVRGTNPTDNGRADVLINPGSEPGSIRAFKTPTLREVHLTFPYGHHGEFPTLAHVVRHYNLGGHNGLGQRDRFIDPRIQPLNLTVEQERSLVTFLREAFASPTYPYVTRPMQ